MDTWTGEPLPPSDSHPAAVITGRDSAQHLPTPEHDGDANEKPLARPAATTAPENLAQPAEKKMRGPLVPATDEEKQKLRYLADRHRAGVNELKELLEQRKELRKHHDELLFRRRCVAAGFVNRIIVRDLDEAYVRHHRRVGLKLGDRLPEELMKARPPITHALLACAEMRRVMDVGLSGFLVELQTAMENEEKRMEQGQEVKALTGFDQIQRGATLDSDAQSY